MGYKVVPNSVDPKRFVVYDDSGSAVAQGSYNGRSDENIIGKLSQAKPQDPVSFIKGATGQIMQNPKQGKAYVETAQAIENLNKGSKLDSEAATTELIKDLYGFRQGIQKADDLKAIKDTGTIGANTGPISGRIPDFIIQAWGGFDPEEAGKRKQLSQGILNLLNPYRKAVTGAQAATSEISKYIEPALPSMKDEDAVFLDALRKYKEDTNNNIKLVLDQLTRLGKDTSQFNNLLGESSKATHRLNPITGKVEKISE